MSAFVFCLNRKGKTVSKELFAPMMDAIKVFGIDGKKQIIKNNFAIGYQRFWTTPEEVNEKQPLYDNETGTWLIFDGRIDNRDEIYHLLNDRQLKLATMSDARLFLDLYKQTGRKYLKKVIGPFVFVFFNEQSNDVFAGRDAMGGRYLVYYISKEWVMLATYEMAISAHPQIGFSYDEKRISRFFSLRRSNDVSTCVKHVTQLHPGFELRVNGNGETEIQNVYLPDPEKRISFANKQEYVEAFRSILDLSIKDRLRTISSVGSMTSGGMDSLPMSVVASKELAKENERLLAVSWVFDQYLESDERQYIRPVARKYDFQSVYINCDEQWPLTNDWIYDPTVPFTTPYRTFHNLAYDTFQSNGIKTVLSGMGGDALYVGFEMQIIELLKDGRYKEAWKELMIRKKAYNNTLLLLKIHLIWNTSFYKRYRKVKMYIPEWLTDHAVSLLDNSPSPLEGMAESSLRPNQYIQLLDVLEGGDVANERFFSAHYNFEFRYPYRDKRLVEFCLQIPSEYLNFSNVPRVIMREAFKNELTPEIIKRPGKASFRQVINSGYAERRNEIDELLYHQNSEWQKYVKPEYINDNSKEHDKRHMLQWMCCFFEFCRKQNMH